MKCVANTVKAVEASRDSQMAQQTESVSLNTLPLPSSSIKIKQFGLRFYNETKRFKS